MKAHEIGPISTYDKRFLAYAESSHGFIVCKTISETEVVLQHGFNRTFVEVRLPVEVWALFLRSAKEAPIYSGPLKNSEYPEEWDEAD